MIIKQYAGLPTTYAPDIGEVLLARRTPADKFVRAVVLDARRNRQGNVRVRVQWLEDDLDAGAPEVWNGKPRHPVGPIKAGTVGWVVMSMDPLDPRLIMQIDQGSAATG